MNTNINGNIIVESKHRGGDNAVDTRKFMYDTPYSNSSGGGNNGLEVVIITNAFGDHDGYLELTAATKLTSPFLTGTHSSSNALWNNVAPSHKLIKNNKNYIHVFSLCKYLCNYNLNAKKHPPEYYTLKSIICDLLLGSQSKAFDPVCEVKTQLCAIQESINETIAILNNHVIAANDKNNSGDSFNDSIKKLYESVQNLQNEHNTKITFSTETILDNIKNIKDLMCMNK
ncbi:p24 [Catopsilia pomona nucleopolyhedrovirus]|uniref:p24 n=1 Tax=Catopsilia pomona nucleopolyhedrovirus TaxID=1850906 RepID=A0A172WZA1_9ABAC|nr:p24 [Catopsilia pomona nucleopolyhedrovirus]ANF29673.1 p24 [Catopsilia pomona nucleopolyhedrovirus]